MKSSLLHRFKSLGLIIAALGIAAFYVFWKAEPPSGHPVESQKSVSKNRDLLPPSKPAPRAGVVKVAPPSATAPAGVSAFRAWAQSYFDAEPEQRHLLIEQGKTLAKAHTIALAQQIPLDPRAAIENAVPMVVRQDLPPEIVGLLEERVNRRGALTLWASTPKPGEEAKTKPFYHTFKPEGSGESRKAYVYGSRLKEKSLSRTLVNGIAAAPIQDGPKVMALAEPRIRTLEVGERPDPTKAMVATCPISGETTPVDTNSPPPISNETPAFEDEETVHYVCSGGHIGIHSTALMDAETKAHWANLTKRSTTAAMDDNGTAGEGGTGGPIVPGEVPTTWTTGVRKVLYMRVAFPDRPQDPQSEASIIEVMRQVSDEVTAMSYGRTYMQATVTPLLMLSRTHDWLTRYEDDNGDAVGIIYSEARELAKALGYDTDQYDLDVVRWNGSVGDFGGSAAVGGKYFSDKAGNKGTCLHEFGHNFGLLHSNAWKGNPPSVIGPGYSFEYACYWDYMGAGSQEADGHYVAPTKAQLGWLPRESQALAQSNGTFRIFQTDQALQDPAKRYVLRARKDRDRDYWFEFRPTLVPGNPWLSNGLLVTHDSWGTGGIGGSGADLATGTNNGPVTLDMNPGTWRPNMTDTRRDSALTVGRTYTDTETNMHVTPVAKNATTPPSMDVTVNFGSPSANAPTQTLNASATSVSTGVTVNFTSTASDLDGDTLAYAWDFGDGTISTDNSSTQAKSWSTAGHYVVRCIVSDMKGSVNTAKVLITVGSPTTFTISGRVLGPGSVPLEGVQVANQVIDLPSNTYFTNNGFVNPQAANYRSGFTDSNGDYIITGVPAGSHTLYANLYPYSFSPTFGNPVTVAANVTGADWNGGQIPTLTLAATDASATEVAGDTGTFRITRSGDTTNALQVQVFNYSGTATLTSDYTVSPSTTNTSGAHYLTIQAGSSFVDVTLTPVNDSASEGIEIVTLTLPNIAAGYRISSANEASITIVDDESTLPVVSLTSNETIASEPSDAATLTLTRTGSTAAELVVSLAYTGTAIRGTDYTAALSVSIPAGQSSTTFLISPSNDAAAEGTETIIVSLATNAAYQRANGVSTVTFDLNDDDLNTVSVAATDATASEAGDPGEFTITRSGSDLSQSLIVDYSVNGSAIHGKDFARLEGRAFIPAGETTATLRISPFNDTIGEGSQTVTLTLRSDGRYLVGSTQSASVTITDDDVSSFYTRTTQTHRDEPVSGETWTARESARGWIAIASSADGSKLAAVDYTGPAFEGGQIYTSADFGTTWTPRESNRFWRSITSSADGTKLAAVDVLGPEFLGGRIYTSTDSGATWTPRESERSWQSITSSADGTKLAAVVNMGQIYTSTDSGATWTARESERSWQSITSSADGTKLAAVVNMGQIYTSTDSGATWTPRESERSWQSIASSADGTKLAAVVSGGQIYTSSDSGATWVARESSRDWFGITSSADGTRLAAVADNAQIYTSVDSGLTWTARDSIRSWQAIASSADGARMAAVAIDDRIYTTGGSSSANTFQIFRQATGAAATVNYTVSGTATSGLDYTALSGSVSFNTSDTSKDISLAVLADAQIENAETVTITLTPGTGYQLAAFDNSSTALILDASQPQVSVSAASAALTPPSVAESATELRFFVSRNTNPATTLTVNYTLSGTATSGTDYTGATGSVTIPASAYGEYITLVPTNDTAAEGSESVTLNVTPASGTYGLRTASATILLTDNDAFAGGAPSVAFDSASSTVSETGGSLNIPVTLTGTPGAPVTVRYAISGGTADLSDVLLPAGTLTFNAAGTQNLVLTALPDVFPETSETVELTLTHAYGATLGTATHVVTLTDVSQPEAFTDSPTAVLATAATVNGGAIPHGVASTAYFEWGTSTAYGNTTASQNIGAGQTEVAVTQGLTGLATGQTYHYRLVATNANGTSYGNDRILTTTTQPAPVTLAASNRTISSATLNATVNPNTVATNAWFEWGTTTAYGNTTATQALGSGGANVAINAGITGLTEGTTYHYRVAAENGGATVYGENQTFVASPYEVAGSLYVNVRANHASAASSSWTNLASLGGSFTEQGDTTLDASVRGTGVPGVLFDGNTMAYVGPESVEDIDGSGDRTVEAWVYNPACEGSEEVFVNMGRRDTQTYGVFALNYQRNTAYGAHIDWGNNTGWGSAVPQTGGWRHIVATYSGPSLKIYVDGVLTIDKSLAYTLNTLRNAISIGSQLTSAGVPASSSYRYSGYINSVRIHGGVLTDSQVAANFARGPDQNTAAPTIANTGASAITTTGATLSASVNPQGLATTAYFEWGTSAAYGNVTATQNLAATGRPVAITAPITGLTPGQTIHFRVVATNGSGTTNGANTTFKPSAYANAGIVYVDLRATDASAGTATWDNVGALGDFVENGNAVPTLDALSTGIPAVQFDRSTAAYAGPVSVPDIDENSDRSFEVWFYNPSDNTTEALFSQGHTGTTRRMADIRHSSNSSNGAANHWADDLGYTTTPTYGAWHHVAYVYDGLRGVKIYTDGVLNSSKTLGADLNTFVEAMALACDRNSSSVLNPSGSGLSGFINSVRVHGGQLSAEQAAANFALGPNLSSNGPTVVTQSTTFLLKDRATLSATVTPNGSATTVYFEYGTSASYGSQTAPQNITGPLASQTISATLTGLITGTTYHFRTVTTNADGTIYGDDQTFTPSPLVSAGTLYVNLRASNGSAATATWANAGSLSDFTEVGDTTAASNVSGTGIPGVQFNGTTTAYNGPNAVADISGASDRSIEAWVFNPAGENSEETIVNFGRQGFTSNLLLAFCVGNSRALHTWVDSANWTTVPSYGQWHHVAMVSNGGTSVKFYVDGALQFTKTLSGTFNTEALPIAIGSSRDSSTNVWGSFGFSGYLNTVRIHGGQLSDSDIARNYQYGPAFVGPAEVFTRAATTPLDDRFTANGTVEPNGQATTAWFEYGTTTAYGNQTSVTSIAANAAPLEFGTVVFGTSGTTYHYRLVAQNASGTVYGDDFTATLSPLASAGTLYVDINATQSGAGTATWPNLGSLGGNFSQIGTPALVSNVVSTNVPGVQLNNGADNGYYGPNSPADITGSSDRTIEAWAYNPSIGNDEVMVDIGRYTGAARTTYTASYGGYLHYLTSENPGWAGGTPTAGVWHHIVYVYDGATNVKAYVDGVLNTNSTIGGTLNTTAAQISLGAIRIGQSNTSLQYGGFAFTGYLNRVRVHGGQLDATQVARNFAAGPAVPLAPAVFTTAADGLTSTGATLRGSAHPETLATSAWFDYGPTTAYGTSTSPQSIGSGSSAVAVTQAITGLTPNTLYHARLVAQNSAGTSYSSDVTFTTTPAGLASLALSAGTLSPAFATATLNYTATVSSTTDTMTVTPTGDAAGSTITVNGNAVSSGNASDVITLATGTNTITIVVTNNGSRTYTLTVKRETPFETFLTENAATGANTGPSDDFDGDGVANLLEYAFGSNPGSNSSGTGLLVYSGTFAGGGTITGTGKPAVAFESTPTGVDYRALFVRRKDHAAVGLTYQVKFSANMTTWQTSNVTPTILADDGTYQVVSVPYPNFIAGRKARFFTVTVGTTP